jgi:hypothetical protein
LSAFEDARQLEGQHNSKHDAKNYLESHDALLNLLVCDCVGCGEHDPGIRPPLKRFPALGAKRAK